jgi:hypothetical protein
MFWISVEHRGLEVEEIYLVFLGREADPVGKAFFVNELMRGVSEGQISITILASTEYLARQASLRRDFVDGVFLDVLGHAPDATGKAILNQQLQTGAITRADVAFMVLSSEESSRLAIDQFYVAFLERPVDPAAASFFFIQIRNGQLTPLGLAMFLGGSQEFFQNAVALV